MRTAELLRDIAEILYSTPRYGITPEATILAEMNKLVNFIGG